MVKGLHKFREYFKDYAGNYVIIGGAACDMILGDAGLTAHATKDIDIPCWRPPAAVILPR